MRSVSSGGRGSELSRSSVTSALSCACDVSTHRRAETAIALTTKMNRVIQVSRPRRSARLLASCVLVAGALTLSPAAHGRTLSLYVTFSPTGTITVTLPDGTPVGTTSGAPTVIPAGYYTLLMSGPGACTQLPLFELKGPGEDIFSDMTAGEVDSTSQEAYFRPNSTYTWRNYALPGVVHTFATSSEVEGTVPAPGPPLSAGMHSTVASKDIVGSGIVPFRGTITGAVSATGRLTLAFNGNSVTYLRVGRYTVTVTDRSSTSGFLLQKAKRKALSVTGTTFVGKRSASVRLTAGRWLVMTRLGKTTYSVVVR